MMNFFGLGKSKGDDNDKGTARGSLGRKLRKSLRNADAKNVEWERIKSKPLSTWENNDVRRFLLFVSPHLKEVADLMADEARDGSYLMDASEQDLRTMLDRGDGRLGDLPVICAKRLIELQELERENQIKHQSSNRGGDSVHGLPGNPDNRLVVISYRYNYDEAWVEELQKLLRRWGYDVWTGKSVRAGQNRFWQEEFMHQAERCQAIISCMSVKYEESGACFEEFITCKTMFKDKFVILRLENYTPTTRFMMSVNVIQHIPCYGGYGWRGKLKETLHDICNLGELEEVGIQEVDEQVEHGYRPIFDRIKTLNNSPNNMDVERRILGAIGSTAFWGDKTEDQFNFCQALGERLAMEQIIPEARDARDNMILITGGRASQNPPKGEEYNRGGPFALSSSFYNKLAAEKSVDVANARTIHYLPVKDSTEQDFTPTAKVRVDGKVTYFQKLDYGSTILHGDSEDEKQLIMGRVSSVLLLLGGGPGAEREAFSAQDRGAWVIPITRLGGVAKNVPWPKPKSISEKDWDQLINDAGKTDDERIDHIIYILKEMFQTLHENFKENLKVQEDAKDEVKFKGKMIWTSNISADLARLADDLAQNYDHVYYLVGHGSKNQIKDVESLFPELNKLFDEILQDAKDQTSRETPKVAVIYGGDPYERDKPDISHIANYIGTSFSDCVDIIAIQCDKYMDYVLYGDQEKYAFVSTVLFYETKYRHRQGVYEILFGGYTKNAKGRVKLHGTTQQVLDPPILNMLNGFIAVGGGPIAREELIIAMHKDLPCFVMQAECKNLEDETSDIYGVLWKFCESKKIVANKWFTDPSL